MNPQHKNNKHIKRYHEFEERILDLSRLVALQDSNTSLGQLWIAKFMHQRDCLIETLRHNYPLMVVKPIGEHNVVVVFTTTSSVGIPIKL